MDAIGEGFGSVRRRGRFGWKCECELGVEGRCWWGWEWERVWNVSIGINEYRQALK